MNTQTAAPAPSFLLAPPAAAQEPAPLRADAPAAAPAPATLPSLDEMLAVLTDERVNALLAVREASAREIVEIEATYRAVADRLTSARAGRAARIRSARRAVEGAYAAVTATVQKIDQLRAYAAHSSHPLAEQADDVARREETAVKKALAEAQRELDALGRADAAATQAEAEELGLAALACEEAVNALVERHAEVEEEYGDAAQELSRRRAMSR